MAISRAAPVQFPATPLSDLAVSPFAMPTALLRGEVRVAWVGRTSTEDQQDPRQSLIRQLERSKSALPEAWAIVCHFYDVESGRLELDRRGHGTGYERFAIPIARDGGIGDLLAEAEHPNRRFDVVMCESTSRVARRMFETLSVERELERAGVPLLAWNEPIKLDGGRAQQILQRRINQSVAEYEVFNALETSWGGLCTHVREGWNIGKPPYGYTAKQYRHPNPVKAARGATKSRLEPDGLRAEAVTQMAAWRHYERLGYGTIAERLNADLERYPPPVPPGGPERARGAWSKSTVRDILLNPKYTGYQVFNRRAMRSRRGAYNDPALWVWSTEPAHEPLIPKWMYDDLYEHRSDHVGSRDGGGRDTHVQTRRTYVFRGRVLCGCERRMHGNQRDTRTYYTCWPRGNNRGTPAPYAGHPKTVYVREYVLLEAVSAFLADRVFGPFRRQLLAADLAAVDDRAAREREAGRHRLRQTLDDLARRQRNVLRQAQDCEPGDPFAQGLRQTYTELESERRRAAGELAQLEEAAAAELARPSPGDAELLDALPYLAINLAQAPEQLLRPLFELLQLTIRLSRELDEAEIRITLPATKTIEIAEAAERMTKMAISTRDGASPTPLAPATKAHTQKPASQWEAGLSVEVDSAPGRIRTCAHGSGGRCSIP